MKVGSNSKKNAQGAMQIRLDSFPFHSITLDNKEDSVKYLDGKEQCRKGGKDGGREGTL